MLQSKVIEYISSLTAEWGGGVALLSNLPGFVIKGMIYFASGKQAYVYSANNKYITIQSSTQHNTTGNVYRSRGLEAQRFNW